MPGQMPATGTMTVQRPPEDQLTADQQDEANASSPKAGKRALQPEKVTRQKYLRPDSPPTKGWQAVLWAFPVGLLYGHLGWKWLLRLTKVSRKESILRKRKSLAAKRCQKPMVIVSAGDKGGCCKSGTTVNLAIVDGEATNQYVLVVDFNPFGNHSNARLGITDTRLTTSELFYNRRVFDDPREFYLRCGYHPDDGLKMVHGIQFHKGVRRSNPVEPEEHEAASLIMDFTKVAHSVYIDLGNGVIRPSHVAAIKSAHVIVVNMLVGQVNSDKDALGTLRDICDIDPSFIGKCVVQVNAHKGKVTPDVISHYYERFLALIEKFPDDKLVCVPPDHIYVTPYDPELNDEERQKNKKTKDGVLQSERPMNPLNYNPATHEAILDCANRIPEIADEASGRAAQNMANTSTEDDSSSPQLLVSST